MYRKFAHAFTSWPLFGFAISLIVCVAACPQAEAASPQFEISFPASAHGGVITGRVFVALTRHGDPEPRLQVSGWQRCTPLFGVDVEQLKPGDFAEINGGTLGYPLHSLRDLPAGDYYVQAIVNIYSHFHRAKGPAIWAHMDQWEGQNFTRSPGNLISEVQLVHLDPIAGYAVKLSASKVIPPVEVPADTLWVKHIKIQSKLLTEFWGQPIYLGAVILLPKGYESHPEVKYPVVYVQGHFSLNPPFPFSTEDRPESETQRFSREHRGVESAYEFYQSWNSDNFPRMIAVSFQHPTPFFDDSYAVNSVNDGPYGDAIVSELIPYIEEHFRIIGQPYARLLTGGSTGGWEALALQVFHPDLFGGTWSLYPDPLDWHRYGLTDIYEDDNAFLVQKEHREQDSNYGNHEWQVPERSFERSPDGQSENTVRQVSQLEDVLGSKGRSAQQLEVFEAVFSPMGEDGYPKPLWDKHTGKIDHDVATYWREHDYDLRDFMARNWPTLGPKLVDKLYFAVGDMDHGYLNLAVYLMEDFLKQTQNPHYEGTFVYGRPMMGHGWHATTQAEQIRAMAEHLSRHAPKGQNTAAWNY
ncbi:MAG: hypothetical protein JOZ80_10290 [Acidobacteriaceae bacterium]|nr:hypothetical protein [Acidobacteriaceae bacterium]